MDPSGRVKRDATFMDWRAAASARRCELILGTIVDKPVHDAGHAAAQGGLVIALRHELRGEDGTWWVVPEVDVRLGWNGFCPDVVAWRRDRVAPFAGAVPLELRPDWICEVLSTESSSRDAIVKMWLFHEAGVPHYWLADPATQTLAVYRNSPEGFTQVLVAEKHERVRAEPFEAFELSVGVLFGDDPED